MELWQRMKTPRILFLSVDVSTGTGVVAGGCPMPQRAISRSKRVQEGRQVDQKTSRIGSPSKNRNKKSTMPRVLESGAGSIFFNKTKHCLSVRNTDCSREKTQKRDSTKPTEKTRQLAEPRTGKADYRFWLPPKKRAPGPCLAERGAPPRSTLPLEPGSNSL